MEVEFTLEQEATLEQLASATGRPPAQLVQDALDSYFDELVETRDILSFRYEEMKSGKVDLIPGEEVFRRLRKKSAARRSQR